MQKNREFSITKKRENIYFLAFSKTRNRNDDYGIVKSHAQKNHASMDSISARLLILPILLKDTDFPEIPNIFLRNSGLCFCDFSGFLPKKSALMPWDNQQFSHL